jgi:hypothetical protein
MANKRRSVRKLNIGSSISTIPVQLFGYCIFTFLLHMQNFNMTKSPTLMKRLDQSYFQHRNS